MKEIENLLDIMARLRSPEDGCPWDQEQTFASIAPYTIEEAYEVADAIARGDMEGLRDELGDLLFQVVYHARMAEEGGYFAFRDTAAAISDKLVRRHPHVFGDGAARDAGAVRDHWEATKRAERAEKGAEGLLDDVPRNLPALTRAVKLSKRAATVGFEWSDWRSVREKVAEELAELDAAVADGEPPERVEQEMGDVLFALANLCRHLDVDPEAALRGCNTKFERRFRHIEAELGENGRRPDDATLEEMEALWQAAKRRGL